MHSDLDLGDTYFWYPNSCRTSSDVECAKRNDSRRLSAAVMNVLASFSLVSEKNPAGQTATITLHHDTPITRTAHQQCCGQNGPRTSSDLLLSHTLVGEEMRLRSGREEGAESTFGARPSLLLHVVNNAICQEEQRHSVASLRLTTPSLAKGWPHPLSPELRGPL